MTYKKKLEHMNAHLFDMEEIPILKMEREWYGITAWNGLGEACAQYLTKGRQVMVEGSRMEVNAWMGRDGNLHTKMELTAKDVRFLGDANGNGNGNGNGQQHAPRQQQVARQQQAPSQQAPQQQAPQQQQAQRRKSAPAPRQRRVPV